MLVLNLHPIFKARMIQNPFTYLVKAGLSRHAAELLLSGRARSPRLEHIEKLCQVLICEPNDLYHWTPEKDTQYQQNHPLFKLTRQITVHNWMESFSSLPLSELKDISIQKQTD